MAVTFGAPATANTGAGLVQGPRVALTVTTRPGDVGLLILLRVGNTMTPTVSVDGVGVPVVGPLPVSGSERVWSAHVPAPAAGAHSVLVTAPAALLNLLLTPAITVVAVPGAGYSGVPLVELSASPPAPTPGPGASLYVDAATATTTRYANAARATLAAPSTGGATIGNGRRVATRTIALTADGQLRAVGVEHATRSGHLSGGGALATTARKSVGAGGQAIADGGTVRVNVTKRAAAVNAALSTSADALAVGGVKRAAAAPVLTNAGTLAVAVAPQRKTSTNVTGGGSVSSTAVHRAARAVELPAAGAAQVGALKGAGADLRATSTDGHARIAAHVVFLSPVHLRGGGTAAATSARTSAVQLTETNALRTAGALGAATSAARTSALELLSTGGHVQLSHDAYAGPRRLALDAVHGGGTMHATAVHGARLHALNTRARTNGGTLNASARKHAAVAPALRGGGAQRAGTRRTTGAGIALSTAVTAAFTTAPTQYGRGGKAVPVRARESGAGRQQATPTKATGARLTLSARGRLRASYAEGQRTQLAEHGGGNLRARARKNVATATTGRASTGGTPAAAVRARRATRITVRTGAVDLQLQGWKLARLALRSRDGGALSAHHLAVRSSGAHTAASIGGGVQRLVGLKAVTAVTDALRGGGNTWAGWREARRPRVRVLTRDSTANVGAERDVSVLDTPARTVTVLALPERRVLPVTT